MDAEDLLFILYTSGSTGKPKGCVVQHPRPGCQQHSMSDPSFLRRNVTSSYIQPHNHGGPSSVAHTTAGYLLYAAMTHKTVFDIQEGDVYACVADCGWITGHSCECRTGRW